MTFKVALSLAALLYLRFTLWGLDLNLLSGPDALEKGCVAGFHIMSSVFNKFKKTLFENLF